MLKIRCGLDLGQEAVATDHGCQFGFQYLQSDLPPVTKVVGPVDCGHTTSADLNLYAIAVRQRPGESFLMFHVAMPVRVGGPVQPGPPPGITWASAHEMSKNVD